MPPKMHHLAVCTLVLGPAGCVDRVIVQDTEGTGTSTSSGSDASTTTASTSASPPDDEGPMMALPEDDDVPVPQCPELTLEPTPEVQIEGVLDEGSPDAYVSSCGGSGPDITYAWTPPRSGRYRFTTIGSDFDTVLTVFGPGCMVELACNDDADGDVSSAVELAVIEGETLTVGISAFDQQFGAYRLSLFPI